MVDLTGANLVAYLLRQIKDIVARSPRFRNSLGEVTFQSNQMIQWGNVQAVIKSLSAAGTRLSPDYFMCTQRARVTVAKLGDYEGSFVEWPYEYDKTRQTPASGVYNLQVDFTSEKTQQVDLTMQFFKWTQGKLKNAQGSVVYFNPTLDNAGGYNAPRIPALDITTLTATEAETGKPITVQAFNSSTGGFMYLLTPCQTLLLTRPDGTTLNQSGVDYWYQRTTTQLMCESTAGGAELLNILGPYVSVSVQDQSGYVLRPTIDFTWQGPDWIKLAPWSPAGSTISAVIVQKLAPAGNSATNPENILNIGFNVGTDQLIPKQVNIYTPAGNFKSVSVNENGTITIPTLLTPGQWMRYDIRLSTPPVMMRGQKYQMNGFIKTINDAKLTPAQQSDPSTRLPYLDPVTQKTVDPLPGLALAIGDNVIVGDQCALVVNPEVTETYEVYGSKDGISFVLETKANDLQTASDLAELIKAQFLVWKRQNMEKDGVSILEAPRNMATAQRDVSGINPEFTFSQQFTGLADWKVYRPLVTRMASFELTVSPYSSDFQGKLQLPTRIQTAGATQFLTSYV
jgi:hypothetical protein